MLKDILRAEVEAAGSARGDCIQYNTMHIAMLPAGQLDPDAFIEDAYAVASMAEAVV